MPVSIRVEEDRADVLRDTVFGQQLLVALHEAAILLLEQDCAWLVLGAADEYVVESITVDVRNRHQRTLGREHLRHQRLPVEIDVLVFVMNERKRCPLSDVGEELLRRYSGTTGPRSSCLRGLSLLHGDALVRRDVLHVAHASVWPIHRYGLYRVDLAESEGQDVIDAGLEATHGRQLLKKRRFPIPKCHLRADRESVMSFAIELHLQIVIVLVQ